MICPFYGMHDRFGVLHPSHGNQCALVRHGFAACRMVMFTRLPVKWESCLYRSGGFPAFPGEEEPAGCLRCVRCRSVAHGCEDLLPLYVCDPHNGLCPRCLHRAELLAIEANGQQRLIP